MKERVLVPYCAIAVAAAAVIIGSPVQPNGLSAALSRQPSENPVQTVPVTAPKVCTGIAAPFPGRQIEGAIKEATGTPGLGTGASAVFSDPSAQALQALARENSELKKKFELLQNSSLGLQKQLDTFRESSVSLQKQLERLQRNSISSASLVARSGHSLKLIAADLRGQTKYISDFQGYLGCMSAITDQYAKYLGAGCVITRFAKVLPIPYGGQAFTFTKFLSNSAQLLSTATHSVNDYLAASREFISRADTLDPANEAEVSELVALANKHLLPKMQGLQNSISKTMEVSASSRYFLGRLNHYFVSGEDVWRKIKVFFGMRDNRKERSFVVDAISKLKDNDNLFLGRYKSFQDAFQKESTAINSLVTYQHLLDEIGPVRSAKSEAGGAGASGPPIAP